MFRFFEKIIYLFIDIINIDDKINEDDLKFDRMEKGFSIYL